MMTDVKIGRGCNFGQNSSMSHPAVVIGDNVKIQNNVSIYTGVDASKTTSSAARRAC